VKTIPVQSSNLRAVGYDPETRELRVEFHSGSVHDHVGVKPEDHSGLMAADSHGTFYNANIKGRYPSKKIGGGVAPMQDTLPGGSVPSGSPSLENPLDAYHAAVRRYRQERA